jgi:hypothetical protein
MLFKRHPDIFGSQVFFLTPGNGMRCYIDVGFGYWLFFNLNWFSNFFRLFNWFRYRRMSGSFGIVPGFGGCLVLHLYKVLPVFLGFLFSINLLIVLSADFVCNIVFNETHMAFGYYAQSRKMSLQRHCADFKLFRQFVNANQSSSIHTHCSI